MGGSNFRNLVDAVLSNSVEKNDFLKAALEWSVVDCKEDETRSTSCVCGKESLRYLFTILNDKNRNELFPIGSTCINKFERDDLNELTSINISLFSLLHAVSDSKFLTLSPELFTRKLIQFLYEQGAFDNDYNNYEGRNDFEFILKMFNKRNKDNITQKQKRKITAIILNSIKPYITNLLKEKTNSKEIFNEN